MWKEGMVCRSSMLVGLPELIKSLGGNYERLFREAGIDPENITNEDTFISWLAFARLISNAAKELNAPDFGLRWSKDQKVGANSFGPIAALVVTSQDVRAFINSWIFYGRVHSNGSYTQIVEDKRQNLVRAVVHYSAAAPDTRHMKEICISLFYQMSQEYMGLPDYAPLRVGFPHKPMADISVYKQYFNCPIEFNTVNTYIEFPLVLMDKKLGPTFKLGQKLLDKFMSIRLAKSPTNQITLSTHIGLILPNIMGAGKSDARNVADALGMSLRKMQRLLKDEEFSYSKIHDQVRQNLAHQMLKDSDISITRIANLLDYTSPIAFTNASKRWFDMPAREYRNASRRAEEAEYAA